MPGSIADYLESALLGHIFNASWTPPASVYLALGTGVTDAGLSGEPSGNGYGRQAITFAAAASRAVAQNADVTFGPVTTTSWGTITHWAVYDAASGGNCMATGLFAAGKICSVGRSPRVVSGQIQVQFVAGAISTIWANRLLDRAFRNVTSGTAKPNTYVAICTSAPIDSDSDISAKEVSGGNYARVQVNPNGGSSPTWTTVSSGALSNASEITFPTPSAVWSVAHMAIVSASTAGELIKYADITDESCGIGDPVSIPAGDLDISMS
jgi:hypothetical protein